MPSFSRLILCTLVALSTSCAADDDPASDDSNATVRGTDETGSPDLVGQVCAAPDDCFEGIDHDELAGPVECLDRVRDGYCTHQCEVDDDCCAVEDACISDFPQVCSPFESTGLRMCFLSCEDRFVGDAGYEDSGEFCQREAHPAFICRSSGGGAENRRICVPGDCGVGARCRSTEDCSGDLECLTEFDGGYCGRRDCTENDDCPPNAVCVEGADFNYCAKRCDVASDCTFCRTWDDDEIACRGDVTLVEEGDAVSVCVVN